jgi:4-carboxymuconolactone decarboxylase
MDEDERFRLGERTRRAVLGDAHVDASNAKLTDVSRDFFEQVTRHAWGEVWTRPGLDRTTRRLLVVAMMTALGRERELRLHMRAALDDGVAPETIREVLIQSAVYAGVPAAHSAFHVLGELLAER